MPKIERVQIQLKVKLPEDLFLRITCDGNPDHCNHFCYLKGANCGMNSEITHSLKLVELVNSVLYVI